MSGPYVRPTKPVVTSKIVADLCGAFEYFSIAAAATSLQRPYLIDCVAAGDKSGSDVRVAKIGCRQIKKGRVIHPTGLLHDHGIGPWLEQWRDLVVPHATTIGHDLIRPCYERLDRGRVRPAVGL